MITAGGDHTCARLANGTVKCWGSGGSGRLGQGNTDNIGDDPGEMGDNLDPIALGAGNGALVVPVTVAPAAPSGASATAGAQSATVTWNVAIPRRTRPSGKSTSKTSVPGDTGISLREQCGRNG